MPLFSLIKRSWDRSFSDGVLEFNLLPPSSAPENVRQFSPVKRPVARALCFDEPFELTEPVSEKFQFFAMPVISNKRTRKSAYVRPVLLVSQVRRSARLSALHDGFRQAPP